MKIHPKWVISDHLWVVLYPTLLEVEHGFYWGTSLPNGLECIGRDYCSHNVQKVFYETMKLEEQMKKKTVSVIFPIF